MFFASVVLVQRSDMRGGEQPCALFGHAHLVLVLDRFFQFLDSLRMVVRCIAWPCVSVLDLWGASTHPLLRMILLLIGFAALSFFR